MEVPECFIGDYFCSGSEQLSSEKRHAEQKPCEHFAIDDLLNFSNEDAVMTDCFFDSFAGNSADCSTVTAVDSCNSSVSGGEISRFPTHFPSRGFGDSQFSGELCVPYEELAELEWLSNLVVEDSFSAEEELKTLHLLSGTTKPQTPDSSSSSETPRNAPLFHPETPLPGKARSKRSRAAPGDWSTRLLHLTTPPHPEEHDQNAMGVKTVPHNKKREGSNSEMSGRKCLHCASEKTPQWRTGPMGPKTLCNACGVRYKSGRLVPEYRPAASPTFVSTKHSNSHRKVLELRKQNELQRAQEQFLSHSSIFGGEDYLIRHRNNNQNGPEFSRHIM